MQGCQQCIVRGWGYVAKVRLTCKAANNVLLGGGVT